MAKTSKISKFDRYFLYTNSVQGAEHDAELLWKIYKRVLGKASKTHLLLQEDFCGTAALCYEWVKLQPSFEAIGIDLDEAALQWGRHHHGLAVTEQQNSRVTTICGDVMAKLNLRPSIICALNFSYFFLQTRRGMLDYFKQAAASLSDQGLFVLDSFGGPAYLQPHRDRRRNKDKKFTYWWNVESFDAISHRIRCHIDYQKDGEAIRKKVFTYDWRLWSIPEIRDLLHESGFSHIEYWSEGLDSSGQGDGRYRPVTHEADCQAWVCYIVARK